MCEFCEELKYLKKEAKNRKKDYGINTYFRVRIYETMSKDRIRKGSMTHRPMKLRYCPMCGIKI